jgi:hypothetical protein
MCNSIDNINATVGPALKGCPQGCGTIHRFEQKSNGGRRRRKLPMLVFRNQLSSWLVFRNQLSSCSQSPSNIWPRSPTVEIKILEARTLVLVQGDVAIQVHGGLQRGDPISRRPGLPTMIAGVCQTDTHTDTNTTTRTHTHTHRYTEPRTHSSATNTHYPDNPQTTSINGHRAHLCMRVCRIQLMNVVTSHIIGGSAVLSAGRYIHVRLCTLMSGACCNGP